MWPCVTCNLILIAHRLITKVYFTDVCAKSAYQDPKNWKDTLKVITMVWPIHVRRLTRYIPKKGLSNSWLSLHCQLVQCYNVLQCWWSKRSPICPQLETPLQLLAAPGNPSLGISPGAARSRLSSAFILYCFAFYGGPHFKIAWFFTDLVCLGG